MSKLDMNALKEAIATHLTTEITADSKTATYFVTTNFSAGMVGSIPVTAVVKFAGFKGRPELSQTSDALTYDLMFAILLIVQSEDDEGADILIDDALMDFKYYLEYPQRNSPIFGSTLFENSAVVDGTKGVDPNKQGIKAYITLETRVMEV